MGGSLLGLLLAGIFFPFAGLIIGGLAGATTAVIVTGNFTPAIWLVGSIAANENPLRSADTTSKLTEVTLPAPKGGSYGRLNTV